MAFKLKVSGRVQYIEESVNRSDHDLAFTISNATEIQKNRYQIASNSAQEIVFSDDADTVLIQSDQPVKICSDVDDDTSSVTFTADSGTDMLTFPSNPYWWTGKEVELSVTGGSLPSGTAASTTYYLISRGPLQAQLATSLNNAQSGTNIDLTTNGTGTMTISEIQDSYNDRIDQQFQATQIMFNGSNVKRIYVKNPTSSTAEVKISAYF